MEHALRERWIACLIALATPFHRPHWQQPDRGSLRRDGEHLVTLARWAEQEEKPDLLLPIASALHGYYDAVGQWRDMLDVSVTTIAYARLLGDRAMLRSGLNAFAWIIGQQERYDEAMQAITEAFTLTIATDDLAWQVEILINMSQLARRQGQFTQASIYCSEGSLLLTAMSAEQQPFVQADIAIEQGKIARDLGDWSTTQALFQEARDVFQMDLDNPRFNIERAWGAYSQFAYVTHRLGNLDEAARMYRESLETIREIGSKGYLATLLVRFATLEAERNNRAEALTYAREGLDWSRRLGLALEMTQAEALIQRLAVAAS